MTMHISNSSRLQTHPTDVTVRCTRPVIALVFMLLALFAKPVLAQGTCKLLSPTTPINAQALISNGPITVGPDVAPNTVLYHARYWSDQTVTVNCSANGTYYASKLYQTTPYPALTGFLGPQGQTVYATPISGIGVYVWSNQNNLPAPNFRSVSLTSSTSYSMTAGGAGNIGSDVSFDIYLVRTNAPLGAGGAINGSNLPTLHFNFGPNINGIGNTDYLIGAFTGSINVVTSTCTTSSNTTVQMGAHSTTELSGPGTTTSTWVPVNISLTNCPAFYGYTGETTDVRSTNTGSPYSPFTVGSNAIQFSVSPQYGVANAANGVMNLASGSASGIGIQLANASGTPVQFSTNINSGLNLTQTQGQNYTIQLQARYYETGSSVTAGSANSSATITLTYL
jgi:type 1 fimbria pilin